MHILCDQVELFSGETVTGKYLVEEHNMMEDVREGALSSTSRRFEMMRNVDGACLKLWR